MTLPGRSDTDAASGSWTEETAGRAFRLLHLHARNGYEPGDCHCTVCDVIVTDLADYLGLRPPDEGVFDPAAQVRAAAAERGWSRVAS